MPNPSSHLVRKILVMFATVMIVNPAPAQTPPVAAPAQEIALQTPAFPSAIRLYPGVAPGSEGATQVEVWENEAKGRAVRNVTVPVLIPVLPAAGKANGTAVIVVPGGAFRLLAIDNEGFGAANLLAQHGVTAYVLKYRLVETPASHADMLRARREGMKSGKPISTPSEAIDDGRRAVQLVRENAGRWGLRPDRIGMIGFSAGAMTTLETVLGPIRASHPDFAGIIYGPMGARTVPDDAPPLFIALAADDPLFANGDFGLVSSWQKAGKPVELHFFAKGGHGFGMARQGLTSDLWSEEFLAWMRMRGLIEN